MSGDIGIVVDGFGISHEPVLSFLERAQPRMCVIINEKEKLANPAQAHTQVFFRNVNDDDIFSRTGFDARHYTANLAFGLAPAVGLYLGNEPNETAALIDNTCAGMEVCIEQGRPAMLFNFSVFHPSDSFLGALVNHERFNHLYALGHFWICGHEYFPSAVAQGIQDGAILRPLWFDLERAGYQVAFSEWGYARGYDAFAGWQGNLSDGDYLHELTIYLNNPDRQRHGFPFCIFMWNHWHGFEIMDSPTMQNGIIALNGQETGEDMYRLTWKTSGSDWKLRSGKGLNQPVLAVIDIDTTPVQLLDLSGGWYHVFVPSLNLTGYMYAYGITGIDPVGFRRIE